MILLAAFVLYASTVNLPMPDSLYPSIWLCKSIHCLRLSLQA
jgi:hypothetical protein